MVEVRKRYLEESTAFLNSWYWQQLESVAKEKPEVIISLGMAQLSELKADVRELQFKTSDIVAKFLGEDRLWWHLAPTTESRSIRATTEESLRCAAGIMGPILERYKLAPSDGSCSAWREQKPNGKPRFRDIEGNPAMKELISDYVSLISEVTESQSFVNKLEREKVAAEAAELWSKVK